MINVIFSEALSSIGFVGFCILVEMMADGAVLAFTGSGFTDIMHVGRFRKKGGSDA